MDDLFFPNLGSIEEKMVIGRKGKMIDITVYPLSLADQMKLNKFLVDMISSVVAYGGIDHDDEEAKKVFITEIIGLIHRNIMPIMDMVFDYDEIKKDDILEHMTNPQLINLSYLIYKMNYGDLLKNGGSLFEKVKMFLNQMMVQLEAQKQQESKGQSPQS